MHVSIFFSFLMQGPLTDCKRMSFKSKFMANILVKQIAACISAKLYCWKEQGRDVLIPIYVHKRVTSTEKDNVIGQIDKMWETSIQCGRHPFICCMYLMFQVSAATPETQGERDRCRRGHVTPYERSWVWTFMCQLERDCFEKTENPGTDNTVFVRNLIILIFEASVLELFIWGPSTRKALIGFLIGSVVTGSGRKISGSKIYTSSVFFNFCQAFGAEKYLLRNLLRYIILICCLTKKHYI